MRHEQYNGKTVYMGIDVHKKSYTCVTCCEHDVIKKDTMPACPQALISYVQKQFVGANVRTVYEAGFSGFHLHRQLVAAKIKSQIVHPGSIEVASRNRVKTDKRDAKAMALQLASQRIKGIYIPSLEQESKRCLSRLRDKILQQRRQAGNQLKALLQTQGMIDLTDDSVVSVSWINRKLTEVNQSGLPEGYCYAVRHYARTWLRLNEELSTVHKDTMAMQNEEDLALIKLYQSAPGVGELTALKLKDELGDMKQFNNHKQLSSYLGLTPSEYSSGEKVRQGHISRQGKAQLRHMLVESAWIAIKYDTTLSSVYQRLSSHRGSKRAIVAVARRLAIKLRACVSHGQVYEKGK